MMIVLDPRLKPGGRVVTPAPRLASLANKRLGVLWNNRLGGDRLLKHVAELLRQKCGLSEIYFTKKTFVGNAAPTEIIDDLVSRVDAVVVGVGD
jgi:diacylglycerol kinase family enzyme